MAGTDTGPVQAGRRVRWAWICLGLTPLGWAVGLLLAFVSADGHGALAAGLGLLGVLCWVVPPTAAVALGLRAQRAGDRHATTVAWTSGTVLVLTLLVSSVLAFGGAGSAVAVLVVLVGLGLSVWHPGSPPT